MFEAKLEEIGLLRDSLAAIAELIDETELIVKEKGIEMVSSDRAVVAVVDFVLSRNAFKEYNFDEERKIGINLVNLMQILRRTSPDNAMTIRLADNKLQLVIESESGMTRSFALPLIDVSKEEAPDMSKLEAGFSASLGVDANVLNDGIEDAELITDSVVFTVRKDQLTMKSESDSSSTQLDLKSFKFININEPVRARYSLDYLKKIFKARKLSSEALISMATDYPMKVQFEVPNKARLSFILAPRVEE